MTQIERRAAFFCDEFIRSIAAKIADIDLGLLCAKSDRVTIVALCPTSPLRQWLRVSVVDFTTRLGDHGVP